jgi:RNA polymerase sigma factor (sigma-70 family)
MKSFEVFTDIQISERVLKGEMALFEIIIRRNNPYLYKAGRSYGYNHEDTQDLMQETFINAYLNLPGFKDRSSMKTWLTRIMLNNCFQRMQKFSFKYELSGTNAINETSMPMYSNPKSTDTAKTVANRELNGIIEAALEKLPEEYRMVFTLREVNGFNVAETAESLGISEGNVKVRLNRAKVMLKKEIEKVYAPEDIFEFNLVYCDAMVNRVMDQIKTLDKNQ